MNEKIKHFALFFIARSVISNPIPLLERGLASNMFEFDWLAFLRKRPLLTFTKSLVRYLKENIIKSLGIISGNTLLKFFERKKRGPGQPTTASPVICGPARFN